MIWNMKSRIACRKRWIRFKIQCAYSGDGDCSLIDSIGSYPIGRMNIFLVFI